MISRRRWAPRWLAILALLATGVLGVPSVSAGNPCFHGFTMPPPTTNSGPEIKLLPCAFAPTVTHVAVGTEVTFYNGPEFSHLITGANQEWGSPDVELAPGKTISYTFDTAGIYPFACVLHPGMSGAIVVGDVADSAGGGAASTEQSAAVAVPDGSTTSSLPVVGIGMGVGALVGAAAVWLALRRRDGGKRELARAE